MIVVNRLDVPGAGRIGRKVDDPELWVLTTEWEGPGVYRRALECGMDAGATVLSAFDLFLGLGGFPEYLDNLFGLAWANATPEADEAACGEF